MITIFGVGPLMAAIRNLIASRKPREPVDQTGVSTVTAGKHAASLSSHNTFSHGLGQKRKLGLARAVTSHLGVVSCIQ
jgi:hypothetical protein